MPNLSPKMMMNGRPSAQRVDEGEPALSAGLARRHYERFLARNQPPGHSQAETDHQAREDAGQEQLGDRQAAGDAEHDEADAGRDDRPDDPGRGDTVRSRSSCSPAAPSAMT